MQLTNTRVLQGRNVFAPRSVVCMTVDLSDVPDALSGDRLDRITAALGTLAIPEPVPDSGPDRIAAVLARAATGLLRTVGVETEPVLVPSDDNTGRFDIAFEFEDVQTALAAGRLAFGIVQQMLSTDGTDPLPDTAAYLSRFKADAGQRQMSVECRALAQSAQARNIPWIYAGDHMLLFGQGRHMKRMMRKFTSDTSQVGFRLAQDKAAANRILGTLGLPVPRQLSVQSDQAALEAARTIGLPVAVKPLNADFGLGVSLDLRTPQAVSIAHKRARQYGQTVLVEQFVAGDDHRILVAGGTVIAVAQRIRAHVVGDGKRTIGQLIEAVNRDPRRGDKHSSIRVRLEVDDAMRELLAESDRSLETVPTADEVVYLRRVATPSNGGYSVDLTDRIHPDNRAMAVRAVKALGLDLSGVDFVTTDIGRSFRETGGVICEVNASPALRPHLAAEGSPRDVTGPILDTLFPDPAAARIPTVLVLDGEASTTAARVRSVLADAGYTVGFAAGGALTVGDYVVNDRDMPLAVAMITLVRDPEAEAAVAACAADDIVDHGLGLDQCDVAVLRGPGPGDQSHWRQAAALLVAAASKVLVDADDDRALSAADGLDPTQVCLIAAASDNARAQAHVISGGSAAYPIAETDGAALIIIDGSGEHRIPCRNAATTADVAAARAAWFVGVAPAVIARTLTGPGD